MSPCDWLWGLGVSIGTAQAALAHMLVFLCEILKSFLFCGGLYTGTSGLFLVNAFLLPAWSKTSDSYVEGSRQV